MSVTNVRYHRGEGHLVNAAGHRVAVTYALEEWWEVGTGNTTILGSIEGPSGLIGDYHNEHFLLYLTPSLSLACTLRSMGATTTYEIVAIGKFVRS